MTKLLPSVLALTFCIVASFAVAAESKAPASKAKSDRSAEAEYPLKTCVVSGEPFTGGDFVTYTHKEAGKPDRVIRLCCEGCIEDFRINPEKFLEKLDDAQAAAKKKSPGGKKS